jgi:hypothetical protein
MTSLAMYGLPPEQWENLTIDTMKPADLPPELPAECWHTQEFDSERAQAALVALCRGN